MDADYEILFERGIDPERRGWRSPRARRTGRRASRFAATARRRTGPSSTRSRSRDDRRRRTTRCSRRARGLHGARARADAPGDPSLHLAPAALTTRSGGRGIWPRPWIGGEPPTPRQRPRSRRDARRSARCREERVRLGQRAGRGTRSRSTAFSIDVHSVTNRDYLEFVEAGGYRTRRSGTPEGWAVAVGRERAASALLGAPPRRLVLAGHVGPHSAADGVAGVRQPRGGVGLRALEGSRRLPTEAEYHRAAFGAPDGVERRASVGRRAAGCDARQLRLLANWDPVPVGLVPARRERVGRPRSRRQRMGVDVHGLRRLRGVPADAVLSRNTRPTSSTGSTTS